MENRPFPDKSNKPTTKSLETALGDTYIFYEKSLTIAADFSQTWTFTKNSGWMLKIHDKKKALFYLIPLPKRLKISLTLRPNEKEALLQDAELKMLQKEILSAKKYSEGFALQFEITGEDEFQIFALFIRKIITKRI